MQSELVLLFLLLALLLSCNNCDAGRIQTHDVHKCPAECPSGDMRPWRKASPRPCWVDITGDCYGGCAARVP